LQQVVATRLERNAEAHGALIADGVSAQEHRAHLCRSHLRRCTYTGMVSRPAQYPHRHGIPHGTVSRPTQYPHRHGIPHGTASRTARHPARHGLAHGTASDTARYPARLGIPHGTHRAVDRHGAAEGSASRRTNSVPL
jgi:hypothetical protein